MFPVEAVKMTVKYTSRLAKEEVRLGHDNLAKVADIYASSILNNLHDSSTADLSFGNLFILTLLCSRGGGHYGPPSLNAR